MADIATIIVEAKEKGIVKVKNALRSLAGQADKAEKSNKKLATSSKSAAAGIGSMSSAFGLIAGSAFVGYLAKAADSMTLVENKLKLVTNSTEELESVQDKLFQSAQKTYSSFNDTVELYSRLARATREYGYSQQETLKVTEAINQAFIVSGSNAQESSAAIIQLGQGLASGALRGDELRSVLEQAPRLAKALADGLGVSVGKLRELGSEGKLTSEKVMSALIDQSKEINAEFQKLSPTMGQAWSDLSNSMTIGIGKLDDITETSSFVSKVFLGWSALIDDATGSASRFDEQLKGAGVSASTLKKDLELMSAMTLSITPLVGAGGEQDIAKMFSDAQKKAKDLSGDVQSFLSQRMDPLSKKIGLINKEYDEMAKKINKTNVVTAGSVALVNQLEQARKKEISILREKASLSDTNKEAASLESIKDKYAELTMSATEFAKYNVNQWYESQAAIIGYTGDLNKAKDAWLALIDQKEKDKTSEEMAKLTRENNQAMLVSDMATAVQREAIINAMYASKIESAKEYGLSVVGIEAERAMKVRAIWDKDKEKHGSMIEGFESGLQSYADEAQTAYQRAQTVGLTMARTLESGIGSMLSVTGQGFKDWGDQAMNIITSIMDAVIQASIVQPLTQGIMSGVGSLMGSFGGGTTSGTSGLGSIYKSVPVGSFGAFHGGGIAGGTPTFNRDIPISTFADAPKYHTGGIIGNNEVPAILQKGEGVFTAEQMSKLSPASNNSGQTTVVINNYGEPADAETKVSDDSRGGSMLEIILKPVKQAVAAEIATPGTMLNSATKTAVGVNMGGSPGMRGGM